MNVILASKSPRRKELLQRLGLTPMIMPVEIDEDSYFSKDENVCVSAERLARDKSLACEYSSDTPCVVVAADTVVVAKGVVLGKPKDAKDARRMLLMLSGECHEVMTAVAVHSSSGKLLSAVSVTKVYFSKLTDEKISAYIENGEPFGKAGAYAIQGLAETFIERIEGSYSNVVGLDVHITVGLLEECGVKIL